MRWPRIVDGVVGDWVRACVALAAYLLSLNVSGEKVLDMVQKVGGLAVEARVESSL